MDYQPSSVYMQLTTFIAVSQWSAPSKNEKINIFEGIIYNIYNLKFISLTLYFAFVNNYSRSLL